MTRLDELIAQKPALGYIGSGISLSMAWISESLAEAAKFAPELMSCGAAAFGLLAGYYTFRLQRRAWKKAEAEDANQSPKL